jgi:predicted ATPase
MQELAPERAQARTSIEDMHLHPVLFEMGARPHPPRDLYRAYLDQSDVFVGIYWQSYGWTAPDMDISGLEDEFVLAASMPRLIYVKEPAPDRNPQLADLLDRVASSGVSFRTFATPEELCSYLSDDLALLLTERFESESSDEPVPIGSGFQTFLPAMANRFVGRDRELDELERLLTSDRERLISLTGPGGIGKSRLALELGHRMASLFADGSHLVILETIKVPDEVPSRIASSLNLFVRFGSVSPLDLLKRALAHREILLILDNFEQVLPAAPTVAKLLPDCPGLRIVVTTRSLLRLRGEREYPVAPLAVPREGDKTTTAAMDLFLERARPSPILREPEQLAAVAEISRRLEGLPLALELAAARTSILTPAAIVERLDDLFGLLRTQQRDLPERQRTMRTAIAWSADLLSPDEKALFRRLAVFAGGFDLESVADVCVLEDDLEVIDRMQTLVEVNLIRQLARRGEPRFRLFVPIREYAKELLEEAGETQRFRDRHADHFLKTALPSHLTIRSPKQTEIFDRLDEEDANIRRALSHTLDRGDANLVSKAGWVLWWYWWGRGRLVEGIGLMTRAVESGNATGRDLGRARALQGSMAMFLGDFGTAVEALTVALDEMREIDDLEGIGYAQTALGLVAGVVEGPDQMMARLNEAIDIFRKIDDEWALMMPLTAMGWMALGMGLKSLPEENLREAVEIGNRRGGLLERYMAVGTYGWWLLGSDIHKAAELLRQSIAAFTKGEVRYGVAHQLGAVAELAKLQDDPEEAIRLYAAATAIRGEIGAPLLPAFEMRRTQKIYELRETVGAEVFEREYQKGLTYTYTQASEEALAVCDKALTVSVAGPT